MVEELEGRIQVVHRAALVLRAVGDHGGGLRLADLAPLVELPKTTIHRVVNALAREDLLRIDPGGRIWLGADVAALSRAAVAGLAAQIRPAVVALHRAVDETVDVSVLQGTTARFIDQIPSTRPLRVVSAVGATFPLHATANGKALLAWLPADEAMALVAGPLAPFTPNTILDRPTLERELADVRAGGLAYDREEHTVGIAAVGGAVVGSGGAVLAISVPAPADRLRRHQADVEDALRAAITSATQLLLAGTGRPD